MSNGTYGTGTYGGGSGTIEVAPPAGVEHVVLDGLDLNDQVTWSIRGDSFAFTQARKKINWASSPLADGASLVGDEDHYENAELVFTVRAKQQVDKDTALGVFHDLTQKLQTARRTPGGIPLVWSPAQSSGSWTWYVQDAEYDELHTSKEGGWFDYQPEMVVHLYLRPFGYGQEDLALLGWSDPFAWDGLTGGRWRFDAGSGTISVSGGQLLPSTEAIKRLYLPFTTADCSVTLRLKVGSTITGVVGPIAKRSDGSNYLRTTLTSTNIAIHKVVAGVATSLATGSYVPTASTFYWLKADFQGDDISLTLYADAQNPYTTDNPTALATASYTLTGGDATQFGSAVKGNLGIYSDPPASNPAEWVVTDFTVRGMQDITSAEPLMSFEIPDVNGHVAAEGRLVVTEGGAKNQAHFEWGLESRGYQPDVVPPLILDSAALVTSGYSGAQATGTNMYDPDASGNNQILSDPLSSTAAVTVCSTGSQLHTGSYKVKARVKGGAGIKLRLAWQAGVAPLVRNDYTASILGVNVQEVDLGTITVPKTGVGTQHWLGKIEAYSPETVSGTLQIDYLELIPQEHYGVARAPLQPLVPDVFAARDGFTQTAGNLNTKALDLGGSWTTSGAATDFTVNATDDRAERAAASDADLASGRYAIAGTSPTHDYAAVQVQADVKCSTNVTVSDVIRQGVVARWVDANNWLMAVMEVFEPPPIGAFDQPTMHFRVYKRVAGVITQLGSYDATGRESSDHTIVLTAAATGAWSATIFSAGTNQPASPQLQGDETVLATGNALDDGRVGLYDAFSTTSPPTRIYDNFSAFAPVSEVVLYASKQLEVRSDRTEREYGGGLWGRVAQYRGDRFFVPSTNGTIARMACKDRRLNVDEGLPDGNAFTDPMTVAVYVTPRYLHPVGAGD